MGHSLARELEFASLGHQAVRCVDPRVGPITDAVINSVCQDPWTTSGAGTQSPPSCIFPPVSYDHMDSPVFDSQMAEKGDEGDSGWAPQDAQGSTGTHLGCTYFCRTDLLPCTVCVPVPASAGLTEPGCSHLPGVNAGRCHPQLQPCLRSCLKSSAPCKPSLRVSPHVRFAFAISFWFPDQDQICLPIRHRDLASSCEQLPVCSPLPKPGTLCPSAYFLCLDAPKDELSRPCATSCLPDVPAYLPCTPAKRVEHVGFRSPSVPLQQASAAGLLPPLRAERIEHVGFRSPRTTVGSDEFYTPGHVVCMPQQPASKAKVQGRSFQQMRPGAAPSRPSSAIFRSPLEGDCHHSPVPCVPVQGVLSDLSERFTSFDAIQQHSGLSKAADWSDDRCRQEAIARSPLPFPTGRISATNVEGFPVPQIIVSQIAMAHTHQTVVIAFSEATGFGGMHILVADVPSWITLFDFLLDNRRHGPISEQLLGNLDSITCLFDGEPGDCHSVVPRSTDVIHIRTGAVPPGPSVAASRTATTPTRPPTPPLPSGVWPPGVLRGERISHASHAPAVPVVSIHDETPDSSDFVVFDVYHHARILECRITDTDERLVMLALEATPEIGSVFHWRRVQFLLPGFPKRQIVLWGDRLPNSVILPIAFGPGPTAVCTVEAVQSFSALQIVILACRACQLPHFLIQGVADSESALWINEKRQYPLDPHAGVSADTARLLGFGISSFLESRHSQSSQLSSVSSGAREAREFLRSIDDSMLGASSHFAVLAEPAHVILLPLPEGASLAELVYRAFGQFPGFDARCGHRILCRPLPGLPPIQVCVWDNLAADQRVLQVVFSDDSAEVFSVRCPAIATPVQLASAASHTGLNSLTPSLADRTQHLTGDGIPLQPAQVYMFRHFEVLRVRAGPPPTRLPGISRFCRSPLPDSLECVTSEDVSDGDHLEQIVVHQVGALPVVLHAAALFRPAQVSHEATQSLGLPANWRLRYPLTAPLVAGTVPHAVLAGAADLPGGSYAICDFRRILRPPIVPFITIQVPAIVTNQVLQDLLSQVLPHLAPYRAIYIDQDRLEQGASVGCAACTVTFLGWSPQTFSWHSNLAPAVLDTLHATAQREGFLHAFARAPQRAVTQHTTSTTTTAFSLLLDGNSTSSTTTRPSAGTGSLGSTESSTSQEEGYSQPGSSSAVPRAATLPTDLATNPDLLDFVHDPLAIHRLDAAEIPLAYSLFDSVLQTRLAYRDASWSVADCLSEAVRHFAHLGPGTVLHVLNDEVAGLPSPQIVATSGIQHHRLRALPIDARPVGHGICVVEVPKIASPYTAVYWARSICPFQGLPPRLAKGFISARAHGRHLSPLVDMPQQVDSLSLWSDSVPSRPGGGVLPLNARMRDLVRDIRDLAADAFANSGEVPAMLHLPGGPPIQFWVNRHDSLAIMADEASSAVWPFTFHSNLRLHLPGTFPLGTDALLHFLVEIEGRCPAGSTIYLFDGRSLGPTGPPFRSMVLPRRIALVALLDAANSLFPEARAANSIRANGRLVTRWEVREYSFPLIRPTASNAPFIEVPPLDESCLPAFAVASLFPGIAIALQTTLGEMHSCGLPPALDLEEAQLPPRRVIEPSPVPGASVDPLPFLLEVPPPNSLVSQAEIVVLSLHFPAFRLWIPTTFTLNQLRNAVAQGVGQQVVALRWPRVVPCLAGSPAVVIASFAQDNHRATLGIVDARRVHPLQGPSIWLITLPQSVQTSELNALALTDRQVVQTPQHTRVDGRHCTGLLRFRQGIFILTISATCDDARDCIDWQHPSDLPVGLQMGFYTEAPLVSSTTTTTCLADPFFPFAPSTTSTTSALPDDAEPRVTFYITSGLFPPLVLHAGDSLDCAELLASAAFRFYEKKVSPPMTTWLLSKRAYQLHNKRWAFFICSGYATHEPREAAVWVDAGPAWPHPYMIHVPCFATWTQVKARIFLQLDSSAHVTVNGILWEGTSHFFANGFVIQIRTRQQHLISRSVLSFADRFDGLLALQCPCDGPVTIDWHTLDPSEQRSRFLQHFRDHLERYRPITECLPPFSNVLLYVQGTGAFLFSAGTRLPAGANDVQNYFDRCLAGVVGDGFVQDLKFVWGDCSLFVVRLPSCSDTLWVHLDGDLLDFWELGESYDLSQIPTFDGHILYPMEEAQALGYAVRQPIRDAEDAIALPGPSRLPTRQASSASQRSIRQPAEELDPLEAEALHALFGTPPEHSISSMDSSELAALAGSVHSSSPGSSTSSSSSNCSSSSSSASAPRSGAAVSLLQLKSLRRVTSVDGNMHVLADPAKLEVFCFHGESHILRVHANATFGDVRQQLAGHVPHIGDCALVPVFPLPASHLQCLAIPLPLLHTGCPCLVTYAPSLTPRVMLLGTDCSVASLQNETGCGSGVFCLGTSIWHGQQSGLIPGMHLTFHPTTSLAVGETTPQPSVIVSPSGGAQAEKTVGAAYAPAVIRSIPTPMRRGSPRPAGPAPTRVTIHLAESIALPDTAFALGVDSTMVSFCLAGHGMEDLSPCLPTSPRVTSRLAHVWRHLPQLEPTRPIDELFLFTDGSFDPQSGACGWAVVALALCDHSVFRVGASWGSTHPALSGVGAFFAELEALLHAEAFAAAIQARLTHISSDCSSALQVGSGFSATKPSDKIGRACIGLQVLTASLGRCGRRHKVAAHADCIPNEIADGLAKCAAFEHSVFPDAQRHSQFWDAVSEGVFEWLWITNPCSAAVLPHLSHAGGWTKATCAAATSTLPTTIGTLPSLSDTCQPFSFSLKILQYNCLSMKGQAASALIEKGLQRHKVHIAGFQETRVKADGIRQEGDFWVASSACNSKCQGGCQVWLHRKLALTSRERSVHWDRKSMMIVRSTPRMLVLLVDVASFKFACVSAHAPTSRASEEAIREFWEDLSSAIGQLPKSCCVLLCVDANARFHRCPSSPSALDTLPDGCNAECFKHLCLHHGLFASAQFTAAQEPIFSWTSPTGTKCLIDYIAFPIGWRDSTITLGNVSLGDLHEGLDHDPICVQCHPILDGCKPPTRFHVPRGTLETEEGKAALVHAWATVPEIGWDVDATTHVACIHSHLQHCLSRDLNGQAVPPRNPVISPSTLELIKMRRHVRRCERTVRHRFRREVLRSCFQGWRRPRAASTADVESTSKLTRRWFRLILWLNARIGKAMGRDRAAFYRQAVRQHHDAGSAQFAFFLRALTRQGRKFRPPAVLRPLRGQEGATLGREALQDALGAHFAVAERARSVDLDTLMKDFHHQGAPADTIPASDLPSLPALASGFAQLQRNRAPGLSGLTPDVFRQQPVLAALTIFPVAMKTFARGHVPAQYAGGLASTVPKPGKASDTPEGWRAILLLESDAKALQKAMRPALLNALHEARAPAQFGGIPGMSLTLPSSLLRAHLLRLHADQQSGGVVFVDVRSAYYSVVRDIISATPAQRRDTVWASQRAAFLFKDPLLREQFTQRLRAGNPLAEFGASYATMRYVQAQLGATWFVSRPDASQAFSTGSGTAPGAPIADTLFALGFSGVFDWSPTVSC